MCHLSLLQSSCAPGPCHVEATTGSPLRPSCGIQKICWSFPSWAWNSELKPWFQTPTPVVSRSPEKLDVV